MEDIREALNDLSDDDINSYYQTEFNKLTEGESLLSFQQFSDWKVVKDMITNQEINLEKIEEMWSIIPKQTINKGIDFKIFVLLLYLIFFLLFYN